jgi:nucleoid-associated protein YgaU
LLLFLFVIPSRINIRIGDNAETTNEEIIVPPQENPPVPEVDQIIFTDKPITIVPVPAPPATVTPPAPPPAAQPVDSSSQPVRYRIKWGDTLWDIAWAYYRNPLRYTVIAQYNGIRNPDRIIAGTYILIPPR